MNTLTLSCNSCGAPLATTSKTRFITCQFCEARLQVVHEGNSVRTEEFEEVQEDLRELRTQMQLMEIDREWEQQRVQYMISGESGEKVVPTYDSARGLAITAVGLAIGGFVCLCIGAFQYLLFAWAGAAVGWILSLTARAQTDRYETARISYRNRRRDVLRKARQAVQQEGRKATN